MYDKELHELFDKIHILDKAFDKIRIVDPVNSRIINIYNNKIEESVFECFSFWGKNKVCDNCVSIRAYNENNTFVKMEYNLNEIYMVTAVPIEFEERRVVIELLKNITDSFVLNVADRSKNSEIRAMLDRLNNMAMKDSLTGIFNRRFINDKLPIELVNANLGDYSIAIIMADIDFFKDVNDTYGHVVGDRTLKHFADMLKKSIKRDMDWVARYGGEEFLICFPGASLALATEAAEQMRRVVEETIVDCGEYQFHITSSFGVASIIPGLGCTMEELIDIADKKLYLAKQNGRNRVEA